MFFPVFFVYVPHAQEYQALASNDHESSSSSYGSSVLHRTTSWNSKTSKSRQDSRPDIQEESGMGEQSSLLSSDDSIPGDIDGSQPSIKRPLPNHSNIGDISGFQLLRHVDFYIMWFLLGILTGIGLMTINNIGNDSNALWRAYDPSKSKDYVLRRQLLHVSIISCASFGGRLLSGIGSDVLVRSSHSRFWCLVASSGVFAIAQVCALLISNPNLLWLVSGINGLGYGALFGVYPALVVDAFGVTGLSMNWGTMTLSPVLWGTTFNQIYGAILDAHRKIGAGEDEDGACELGLQCYRSAYIVTLVASMVCIFMALGTVVRDRRKAMRLREELHDRTD